MTRVLFVDDEPQVLDSLRDALRPRRHEWSMSFADSGEDALGRLDQEAYDVIVSDMRMNGMDGAALLGEIERSHPAAVRIVLSGSAERDVVVRAAAVAHRFLAEAAQGVLAAVGERHRPLVPVRAQRVAQAVEHLRLVVDEENPRHEGHLRICSTSCWCSQAGALIPRRAR